MRSMMGFIALVAVGASGYASVRAAGDDATTPGEPSPTPPRVDSARRIARLEGFHLPEGARFDPDQDIWFVSSINVGATHDNNGYISRIDPDGRMQNQRFIAGGANGVTLHGPKGMVLVGDTLWVADLDAVRAFHRRTGAPLGAVDFAPMGALFLNDVGVGPDGSLYITDTGVRFDSVTGERRHTGPDRIFHIDRARRPSIAYEGPALDTPNGITYDTRGRRFLLAPGGKSIQRWTPGSDPVPIATGIGRYDGIEVLPDGRVLVAVWSDSSLSLLEGDTLRAIVRGLVSPADIGVDVKRGRVMVPMVRGGDAAELWEVR